MARSNEQIVTTTSSGGIGFCSALTLIFITLKLCGVINWSWIWVLSPLWISLLVTIVLFLMVLMILGFVLLGFALKR